MMAVGAKQHTFSIVPLLTASNVKVTKMQSKSAGSQSFHCQLWPFEKQQQQQQNGKDFFF